MRHYCSRCKLSSTDGNLWCQELDCPAGALPQLFNYGDRLGDLKVLDLVRVLRTATLYRAVRGDDENATTVLLKVANPGAANVETLKREADALRYITQRGKAPAALPAWLPHGAVNASDAYGIASARDQVRTFYLMQDAEGELLSDLLLDNRQPWHQQVGWFVMSLCDAVLALQAATGCAHLNINPDAILVLRNNANIMQPYLLDMGLLLKFGEMLNPTQARQYREQTLPAYTPPLLLDGGQITPQADVYGLGLVLYEMLAGKPAYAYALRRSEDIYADIHTIKVTLRRPDLPSISDEQVGSLLRVLERAIGRDVPQPYQDVSEVRNALFKLYGAVKNPPKRDLNYYMQRAGRFIALGFTASFIVFVILALLGAILN